MRSTRVLHVIRPAEGGMKGHLASLAAGLREKGYDIEVACPGDTALARELKEAGFTVHPVNLVGPLSPANDMVCVWQLRGIIRRGSYHIVHFHGSKAGLVGRIAAVLAGFPNTVLTVHNFIVYEEVPAVKKVLYRCGERVLSRFTSKIITVSEALKNDLIQNYKINSQKIISIYNGIDTSKYLRDMDRTAARTKFGIKPDTAVVGTVARMAPQKGLNFLIEAIPLINAKICQMDKPRNVTYIIAGDGPLRPELESQAARLGVDDTVIFPGFVEEIRELFACLDIFVIPSIAEGLSITTIEAMAAGLPVIASQVGGLPELVKDGETGFLVEPRNPEKLAEAVLRLLGDRDKCELFGQNARSFAGVRFNTEAMIDRTSRVYKAILRNSSRV